jgi:hypothetical protein
VFRFTIRDLLWLTVVVALGLGWFVRERQRSSINWQERATFLRKEVEEEGWQVEWGAGWVGVRKPGEFMAVWGDYPLPDISGSPVRNSRASKRNQPKN